MRGHVVCLPRSLQVSARGGWSRWRRICSRPTAPRSGLITVHHSSVSPSSRVGDASYFNVTSHARLGSENKPIKTLEMLMMNLISSPFTASAIASSVAAPASALDARQFWDQYDRLHSNQ